MQETSSGLQLLENLFLTGAKLLGRPVVQLQLAVGIGVLVAAWLLSRWIVHMLEAAYTAKLRPQSVPEGGQVSEQGAPAQADEGDQRAAEGMSGFARAAYLVARQIAFPLVALVLMLAAALITTEFSGYSGLLTGIAGLVGLFLFYRLLLGLLDVFASHKSASRWHWRLLAPLFVVVVLALVVDELTNLETLLRAPLFTLQEGPIGIGALFLATVGFYFWVTVIGLSKDGLRSVFTRVSRANAGTVDAVLTLVQAGLIILGVFGVFRLLQLNPATVAAITGGISLGVGFALQDVIKNSLGGLIVLFEGSVRPGDLVEIAGTEGEVDRLNIRSTVVRTFDNVEYIVPNQEWLASTVKVYTHTSRRVRVRVPVGVSYHTDPHLVSALLVETARSHPAVLSEPAPVAPLINFGEFSLDFVLLAWIEEARIQGLVANELRLLIWDALAVNQIEIPYPQRDVHIHYRPTE